MNLSNYTPKLFSCLKEGYSRSTFFGDLFAGVSVGVIALPLALAFAIGSGVPPERGLFTAIIAGFLISFLGGSRVQIGGPTGAFVIIVYAIVQKHGYDGLALATVLAGFMMIGMGLARFGVFLKFIPFPVTTGFTTGIALAIVSSQLKDFFGLKIDALPPQFLEKCRLYCLVSNTVNISAVAISSGVLALIFVLRHYFPRFPGVITAIILATQVASLFELPVETIATKFGEIPRILPEPTFPDISYARIKELFPDAIAIALLGAIESLLSAAVADGMTGHRHRSNCELVAQGTANIGSILFGGIPATGAIARTTANINLGAKTPIAGMIHALTLLLLMLIFAPLAAKIPLSALSAVLVYVAWNMSELPHFIEILKGDKSDALILVATFLLTVLIDLAVAVQVGVLLSAVLFVKKMTDNTSVEVCRLLLHEKEDLPDSDLLFRKDVPDDVALFEITGPFFYSIADLLDEALSRLPADPRVFILRLSKVPIIDVTGSRALKAFKKKCDQKNILFLISGASNKLTATLQASGVEQTIGKKHFFVHTDAALKYAREGTRLGDNQSV